MSLSALSVPGPFAARLTLTIRVLDQANLPANRIDKMERYVEETLASIEVDMKWVECPKNLGVCRSIREPNEFWLRILALKPPDVNPAPSCSDSRSTAIQPTIRSNA
jgi:hypothetical protein